MADKDYSEDDIWVMQFRIGRIIDKINTKGIVIIDKMKAIGEYRLRAEIYNSRVEFECYDLNYTGGE